MAKTNWKYPDLFTALGKFINDKKLRDVCVIEYEDGIIVSGSVIYDSHQHTRRNQETFVLSRDDLQKMIPQRRGLFGG
jgi:hypothetical protein